jgi:hypothetical protein
MERHYEMAAVIEAVRRWWVCGWAEKERKRIEEERKKEEEEDVGWN